MTNKQIVLGIISLILFGAIFVCADYIGKSENNMDWLGVVLVLVSSVVFFLFQKTIDDGNGNKTRR